MDTKEKALKYAQRCWGIYFDDIDEDCNASRGEICQKDYLAGYEQCETDYDTLKQRHDEAMELLGESAKLLMNTMEFELVKEYQDKVKKIETLINKNK